jgi:F-type H+-transporting ATPase subunit beta
MVIFAHLDGITVLSRVAAYKELFNLDRIIINGARKIERFLSQPLFIAEVFIRIQGRYIHVNDTTLGFIKIITGELDIQSEGAFYLKGSIGHIMNK